MFGANPTISTLLALGFTLALIWLAAKLLTIINRNGTLPVFAPLRMSSGSPALTLESVIHIAPRRKVVVLRYGEQRLALLTGGPMDVSLGWLPPSPPSPPSPLA